MEVYNLKVKNLTFQEAVQNIIRELKKLYSVKMVDVDLQNSNVKIVLDELGSILACTSVLNNMGYRVEKVA